MDFSYLTGYLSITICMPKSVGSLDKMSSASSSTNSYNTNRQEHEASWYHPGSWVVTPTQLPAKCQQYSF